MSRIRGLGDEAGDRPVSMIAASPAPRSIAALAAGADRLLGAALALSLVLLVIGWTAPVMTVRRLFLFGEPVSLIGGLHALAREGSIGLFAVVALFTILFPAVKLFLAWRLWRRGDVAAPGFEGRLRLIETLGRWSMMDVFLVSLTVAAVEISLVADVHLHWGLYAFAAGVILSMIAFTRMTMVAARMARGAYP